MGIIAIGSDHAAFAFKEEMKSFLLEKGYEIKDFGTNNTESVDYSDYGFIVGESVAKGECERGIVICGTGIGISISANKVKGVRAALCNDIFTSRLSREHNNANVLALGAWVIGSGMAKAIIETWLETGFEGGRHLNRINKISGYEELH